MEREDTVSMNGCSITISVIILVGLTLWGGPRYLQLMVDEVYRTTVLTMVLHWELRVIPLLLFFAYHQLLQLGLLLLLRLFGLERWWLALGGPLLALVILGFLAPPWVLAHIIQQRLLGYSSLVEGLFVLTMLLVGAPMMSLIGAACSIALVSWRTPEQHGRHI